MPNQRDIAHSMGVSQVAVSLALRGDRSVSAGLRKRVRAMAKQMGYRPNPYVSTLMSHIRSGRKATDKGVLALLADVYREEDWLRHESYRVYYKGVARRSAELGFKLELFFLMEPGMTAAKVDRILYARGIRGLILAPPYLGNRKLAMQWNRYACVGTGYAWSQQQFDRVAHEPRPKCCPGLSKTLRAGLLPDRHVHPLVLRPWAGCPVAGWFSRRQRQLPKERRIPLFVGSVE